MALFKKKVDDEVVELPARPRAEIEAELIENAKRAKRYSYVDTRWGPLHAFINELLDEWEISK